MSRKKTIATLAAFALAAAGAAGAAWFGAAHIEASSRAAVTEILTENQLDWAGVETDGLQLILTGTAPSEPARLRAVTRAGDVVDPRRIIDAMEVEASAPVRAARFSLEVLRNEAGVSAIGLVPGAGGAEMLAGLLDGLSEEAALPVTNMVESADYPVPPAWEASLRFAVSALERLPRSKITVEPGRVTVTAVADSAEQKAQLETELARRRPRDVALALDIAAPRPVITPFTLRFILPADGAPRFEACAVDSEAARARVLTAASAAGFTGKADCEIGLGVPSASWGAAVAEGIAALDALGGGTLTLSDADVSLIALEGTSPELFERVTAELDTALPEIFALSAVLPAGAEPDAASQGATPEFTATLSPEGQVQLRGRLYDAAQQQAVLSYGRALFGVQETYIATREDPNVPQGWPTRVLAALEALSRLESGVAVVRPDILTVRGLTGSTRAEATLSGLLSDKLGAEAEYRIEVEYREELDPLLNIPTPEECETRLNAILVEQKLTFAPGEAVIEAAGEGQLGRLTETLKDCERAAFEIGGHTDSQGREEMNEALSQERAEAVRAALLVRGASPSQLIAVGYGETQPIADNDTEEGREANRRITFTLLGSDGGEASAQPAVPAGGDSEPGDDAAAESEEATE
ncbi:OmpA family protein [Jannaschia ovalis]|uniref:OmpA family protein n=1 Tax=Jannaschia ovalis TaxID=3038773 RepID=A0ABY8LDW6_9RHOB|nr:OmpA family protein [Jannaschia sp. GRR-S6-38]WGH79508.1 OmpA family protein [Jannaschia sp. GRR-S6-38]